MSLTEFGMLILVKLRQLRKADSPMLVTDWGILILVKLVLYAKFVQTTAEVSRKVSVSINLSMCKGEFIYMYSLK